MPASMHLAESLHMRCGRHPHIGRVGWVVFVSRTVCRPRAGLLTVTVCHDGRPRSRSRHTGAGGPDVRVPVASHYVFPVRALHGFAPVRVGNGSGRTRETPIAAGQAGLVVRSTVKLAKRRRRSGGSSSRDAGRDGLA
jgi:hypothetical protein